MKKIVGVTKFRERRKNKSDFFRKVLLTANPKGTKKRSRATLHLTEYGWKEKECKWLLEWVDLRKTLNLRWSWKGITSTSRKEIREFSFHSKVRRELRKFRKVKIRINSRKIIINVTNEEEGLRTRKSQNEFRKKGTAGYDRKVRSFSGCQY